MLGKLPEKWIYVSLSELFKLIRGVSYSKQDSSNERKPNYLPILRANNIGKRQVIYENFIYVDKKYISEEQLIKPGDILIAMSSGSKSIVGKAAQIKSSWEGSFGAFCSVARPLSSIDGHYLNHLFQSGLYRDFISKRSTGININNIRQEYFDEIKIPLPPLPEQERISASLEALFESLDAIQYRLDNFPKLMAELRQQILQQAVTGKLTKDWRKKNTLQRNSKVLFERISKGRNMHVFELRDFDFPLPRVWNKCGFTEVAVVRSNLVDPKKYKKYPHIAPDNIERESGKLLFYKTIAEDKIKSPNHLFRKGQIVYSKIRPYLSKVILATFDGLCSADMYPIEAKINSRYLLYYMLSNPFKQFASTAGTRSVLPKINQDELSIIPVPLPSITEQKEITRRIKFLFKKTDKVERQYERLKETASEMPQAILSKAYSGKLVPQNPKDEPVEKLLERIREEKTRLFEEHKEMRTTRARKKAGRKLMAEQKRKELLEVIRSHRNGISPEDLLREAHYELREIALFYKKLKLIREQIIEIKPSDSKRDWPKQSSVILKAQGE